MIRDRFGEKPLYFGIVENNFIFGSELKVFKKVTSFANEISRDSLNLFLRFAYVPGPKSIYKNIFKLLPGAILKINRDNLDKIINFTYGLKEPEMLFLDLDFDDGSETKSLSFFAENNKMDVITSLDNYGYNVLVKGSRNDSILRDYILINKKFNDEKLDLFERSFANSKTKNTDSLKIIENSIININTRQFLHNANYAVRNANYEIAPYIAVTDLFESKKILDTVYKSLKDDIKNSKYALQLKSLID